MNAGMLGFIFGVGFGIVLTLVFIGFIKMFKEDK